MKAIDEARNHKGNIEHNIRRMLENFTKDTGLIITAIDVTPLETTTIDDDYKKFGAYHVEVTITI